MSVSAAATSPPVQDSAVAIVSLRIRQRSSSERERARVSLPLISIAPTLIAASIVVPSFFVPSLFVPRQTDSGARGCGNAFFAAGEAKPLAGCGLDGHPRYTQAGDLGDPRAHGVAVRTDFWPLANQRHLEMCDAPATGRHAINRIFQESVRGGALPLRVAWRKM